MTRISFAIGLVTAALGVVPAMAADLGRFPPGQPFYAPPPMLRVYNWTGCYFGGQLGGAFADNKANGQFLGFSLTTTTAHPAGLSVARLAVTCSLPAIGSLARRLTELGRGRT